MSIALTLRAEILKTKRSASLYLTLIAAAFGPFFSLLDILLDGIEKSHRKDILNDLFTDKFQITGGMLLPFFIMLTCTLLPQIEYRNNAWKQVLSSPQRKANVFFAKFVNIQWLIALFLVFNLLFMFIIAIVVSFKEPSLHVFSQSVNYKEILLTRVNSYLVVMAMCAAQFWLGVRCKNFIIPLAVGMALWFTGTMLVFQGKADLSEWFPYSYHIFPNFPQFNSHLNNVLVGSLMYTILFLLLGYWDFAKHEKKKI